MSHMKTTNENLFGETLCLGGVPVPNGALGFGKPGDWYYTRIIYPDDIREAKRRVDSKFQSVDRDVKGCAGLTDADRASWGALYGAWRQLYCINSTGTCTEPDASIFGLGGQMDDVERYEKSAYDWQLKIKDKCTLSSPVEKPDIIKREESEQRSDVLGTVKIVALAAVGVVAVVVLVPQIAKLVPERQGK